MHSLIKGLLLCIYQTTSSCGDQVSIMSLGDIFNTTSDQFQGGLYNLIWVVCDGVSCIPAADSSELKLEAAEERLTDLGWLRKKKQLWYGEDAASHGGYVLTPEREEEDGIPALQTESTRVKFSWLCTVKHRYFLQMQWADRGFYGVINKTVRPDVIVTQWTISTTRRSATVHWLKTHRPVLAEKPQTIPHN